MEPKQILWENENVHNCEQCKITSGLLQLNRNNWVNSVWVCTFILRIKTIKQKWESWGIVCGLLKHDFVAS